MRRQEKAFLEDRTISDRRTVTFDLSALHRICQQLAHVSGASLPPRWPDSSAETLELLGFFVEMCSKQLARQRQRNESFRQVEEDFHKVEALKGEFIKNVSHELRTPLASIEGFGMALLRGLERTAPGGAEEMSLETRQRFLKIICQEARRLGELIEDVLELTEIEARPRNGNPTLFVARDVFQEAVVNFRLRWGEGQSAPVRMELEPLPGGPPVFGNRDAIREILRHLLDNAHKFSGGQEIVLGANRAAPVAGAPPARTRLWVRDRGLGIPRDQQGQLFTRFHRVETAAHTLPGTGLGLSIVQTLARQNGGSVQVDSNVGEGATFSLFLPEAAPE